MYRSRLRCGAIGFALLVIVAPAACVSAPTRASPGASPTLTVAVAMPEKSVVPSAAPQTAGPKSRSGVLSAELESLLVAYEAGDEPQAVIQVPQLRHTCIRERNSYQVADPFIACPVPKKYGQSGMVW